MFPSSLRKRSRRWEPPSPGGQLWDETLSLTRVPGLNARLCPACQKRSGSSQKAARMKAGHCRQKDEAAERGPLRGQRETDAGPRPSRRGPGPHAAPAPSRALSLLRSKNMTLPRVSPTRCLSSHPVSRASRRAPGGVEARWLREPHPVSPPYSSGKHTHTQSHIHGHTQSHAHALARTAPAARSRGGRARGGPRAVLPEERAWLPRCTRAEFGKNCSAPRRKEPGPQRPRPRAAERGLGPEALAGPGLPRTRGGGGDLRRLSRQRPGSERPLQQGARGRDCLGLLSEAGLRRGRHCLSAQSLHSGPGPIGVPRACSRPGTGSVLTARLLSLSQVSSRGDLQRQRLQRATGFPDGSRSAEVGVGREASFR